MKLTLMLILFTCLASTAAVHSQDVKMDINLKKASINQVLKTIEKGTSYKFVYRNNIIPDNYTVSMELTATSVADILDKTLKETGLSYRMLDNGLIVVYKTADQPADVHVAGIITDDEGTPLPGVTVRVKSNSKVNTATDENGHFSINVPGTEGEILLLSYVGFKDQEYTIVPGSDMRITMIAAPGSLKEIVVLGYSEQKRSSITGSVSTVSGAEIRQSPSGNISNSLVGRLPGLVAFQGSGQPGRDDSRLLIRGLSSSTNSSPLIVIDGIPQEAVSATGGQANAVLPHIDPSDVENISILKDAGTAAVYGARAANGVILITTRRGEKGRPSLNYTFNGGWQKPTVLAKVVDSYQYATLSNELYNNEGTFNPLQNRGYTAEQLEVIRTGSDPDRYANTDWYSALMKPSAFQARHNISVNGGGDKSRYFVSAGYLSQDGVYSASGYKQYSLRTNLDADISKNLKFSLNLNGRQENVADQIAGSAVESFYRQISPLIPSRFSNGLYNYVAIPTGFTTAVNGSPYLIANGEGGYSDTKQNVLESVGSLVYNVPFVKGLSAKGTFSFNRYNTFRRTYSKPYVTAIRNDNGTFTTRTTGNTRASLTENYSDRETVLAEASLSYKRLFGKHGVEALALYTQTQNNGNSLTAGRSNFPSPQVDQLFAGDPATATATGVGFKNARQSVVGRVAYNYSSKYLMEFSFRYDGSDVFPKNDRFGFFPAVSAGWVLSEEDFVKSIPAIDYLKVRGSYGRLGNDRIGQYEYLNTYTLGTGLDGYYTLGNADLQALVPGVIPNASFTWEKADLVNFGLEAQLFGNKLGIEADIFYKRTTDILGNRSATIPATIGGSLPSENLSTIDSKGFELALSHQGNIGGVSYSVKPNVTFNKNKIIYAPQAAGLLDYQSSIGHPIYSSGSGLTNLGYVAEGLYQSTQEITSGPTPLYTNVAPGDIRYADTNGDGKITPADRVIIGKGDYPQLVYGLSLSAGYKGFDFNALFQGAAQVQKYMGGQGLWAFANSSVPTDQNLDRWTPENTDATYPRLFKDNLNNQAVSSYWLRDASYIRLKNLELGYTLPAAITSGLKISAVRFFVSGTNLFTITDLKGVDPESGINSFGANSYLIQKLYNVGLNVKF